MEHLAYSPDLAPSDYHLFSTLKDNFGSHKFQTGNDDVKAAVIQYSDCKTQTSATRESKSCFHDTDVSVMVGITLKSKVSVIKLHVYCFC